MLEMVHAFEEASGLKVNTNLTGRRPGDAKAVSGAASRGHTSGTRAAENSRLRAWCVPQRSTPVGESPIKSPALP